jgi:hypothetical protein
MGKQSPALLIFCLLLGASARAEPSALAELRSAAGAEMPAPPSAPASAPAPAQETAAVERTPLKSASDYRAEIYKGMRTPLTKDQLAALRNLSCTPEFIAALNGLWTVAMRDEVEYMFAVVVDDAGRFSTTNPQKGRPGSVRLAIDAKRTVAVAHTHLNTTSGNESHAEPSDADMDIPAPNFTVSEKALYTTDPGRLQTHDPNRPCGPAGISACFQLRGADWRAACPNFSAPVDWAP